MSVPRPSPRHVLLPKDAALTGSVEPKIVIPLNTSAKNMFQSVLLHDGARRLLLVRKRALGGLKKGGPWAVAIGVPGNV